MNLPNKLTVIRVVLVPFFVFFLMAPTYFNLFVGYGNFIAFVIFIAACVTDLLDGKIARKYNLVTNFGKFMDPLADKLLVCSALICLIELGKLPSWIVCIIIAREFIISGFRLIASDKGVVIAANILGKIKTVLQMIMIMVLIFGIGIPFGWLSGFVSWIWVVELIWTILEYILITAATIFTIVSLVDYIIKNKDVLKDPK